MEISKIILCTCLILSTILPVKSDAAMYLKKNEKRYRYHIPKKYSSKVLILQILNDIFICRSAIGLQQFSTTTSSLNSPKPRIQKSKEKAEQDEYPEGCSKVIYIISRCLHL